MPRPGRVGRGSWVSAVSGAVCGRGGLCAGRGRSPDGASALAGDRGAPRRGRDDAGGLGAAPHRGRRGGAWARSLAERGVAAPRGGPVWTHTTVARVLGRVTA